MAVARKARKRKSDARRCLTCATAGAPDDAAIVSRPPSERASEPRRTKLHFALGALSSAQVS